MAATNASHLIRVVRQRLMFDRALQAFAVWASLLGGVFAIFLIVSRCFGLWPGFPGWQLICGIPVLAAILATLTFRRPSSSETARYIDQVGKTKDLFLTFSSLSNAAGEYQPIVAAHAEKMAPMILPSAAVPFHFWRRIGYAISLWIGAVVGMIWLPQFDPFGNVSQLLAEKETLKVSQSDRRDTQTRAAQIKKEDSKVSGNSRTEDSIDQLKKILREMKPQDQKPNLDKLNIHQAELSAQWKGITQEKLKSLLKQSDSSQSFGGERGIKIDSWTEQLKDGDSTLVQEEIRDLVDLAKQIAVEKDPAKQAELRREMKERLKDLERFASEKAGAPEMSAAVRRAMRQMEAAQKQGMDPQALKDLQESLELSQLEMQQITEAAKDLKELEEALKTMQMAKQVNDDGMLDGEQCQGCQTLEDYAAVYKKMMAESPEHDGEGTGGSGFGKGGAAEERDDVKTAFNDENSKSAIDAGKTLLSIKTTGIGPDGVAVKDYRTEVEAIKQAASEAILQEQIPPGYHDSIRGYFDSQTFEKTAVP